MSKYLTNGDKILQAVLADPNLIKFGDYNPNEVETIDEALDSENAVIHAVALIIDGKESRNSQKEIYNKVQNYLTINL